MVTQAIPPHSSGDFWFKACEFSVKLGGFQNLPAGFGHKSAGRSFEGGPAGFAKSANSLIIL
jgi:hypothetical protein